ncbi:MAG TPA: hypothetical protein VFB12_05190 [Ktedonobacteraceae bacterium]|nr:hypothetical protein [Ktedonobacteraceae bacterium]
MPAPTVINVKSSNPGILIRAIWFICIGWWFGLIWLHIGYALCATGLFLPVGLMMLNRLPSVLTLKAEDRQSLIVLTERSRVVVYVGGPQVDFVLRVLYFLLVGWWAGYLWALTGYLFCFTIFLMPLGVMMLNQLPEVLTLRQQ